MHVILWYGVLFSFHFFQYPVLKQLFELRGHKSEIEDISCHPTEFKVHLPLMFIFV
jgi:hypothetical protein